MNTEHEILSLFGSMYRRQRILLWLCGIVLFALAVFGAIATPAPESLPSQIWAQRGVCMVLLCLSIVAFYHAAKKLFSLPGVQALMSAHNTVVWAYILDTRVNGIRAAPTLCLGTRSGELLRLVFRRGAENEGRALALVRALHPDAHIGFSAEQERLFKGNPLQVGSSAAAAERPRSDTRETISDTDISALIRRLTRGEVIGRAGSVVFGLVVMAVPVGFAWTQRQGITSGEIDAIVPFLLTVGLFGGGGTFIFLDGLLGGASSLLKNPNRIAFWSVEYFKLGGGTFVRFNLYDRRTGKCRQCSVRPKEEAAMLEFLNREAPKAKAGALDAE